MLNHLKSVLILSIFTLLLAFCSSEKKPGEAGNGSGNISEIVSAYFYNPLIVGKDISGYSDVKYVIYDANGKEIDTINSGDNGDDIVFTNDKFVAISGATNLTLRTVWATKYVGHTVRVVLFFTDNGKKCYSILPNITIKA